MKQAGLRNSRYLASRLLYLIDGKRSLADLAHLTHRSEPDVAYTLVRLLESGYIGQVSLVEDNLKRLHSSR